MSLASWKRFFIGEPLPSYQASHERVTKLKALSTLSSDALSSVAYATDSIVIALVAFSSAAITWSVPVALAITGLLVILIASYRQTIDAYPSGGGAYTVAKENLGLMPGLVAGAALLIDYILTVSVSVASGVENIASAFPWMIEYKILIASIMVIVIMWLNLRGIRESATVFAFPTYFFIFSIVLLIGMGLYKVATGQVPEAPPLSRESLVAIPTILFLRAFAGGCSALTGVEAISNGVPIFEHPTTKNAKATLTWMATILGSMFLGITVLTHFYHLSPETTEASHSQTLLSLLGRSVFGGDSILYYSTQVGTALILFIAANTAYTGFPRLASILARDRFLPRQMAGMGDRLVFSKGIWALSVFAILLIVLFDGETHALIPLYAVGVFLSFTLSQLGMVVHQFKDKPSHWIKLAMINALGAIATCVVFIDIIFTKFTHGAWMVAVAVPAFVLLFKKVYNHYLAVGKELSSTVDATSPAKFQPIKHTVIVPVSGIHRGVFEAIQYALTISPDVRACYVDIDSENTERMRENWERWAPEVPFVTLKSPYRSVIKPILDYVDDVEQLSHDDVVTVVVPEFITSKWWHRILHNQTAIFIRAALSLKRGKVVTSVRYHLKA